MALMRFPYQQCTGGGQGSLASCRPVETEAIVLVGLLVPREVVHFLQAAVLVVEHGHPCLDASGKPAWRLGSRLPVDAGRRVQCVRLVCLPADHRHQAVFPEASPHTGMNRRFSSLNAEKSRKPGSRAKKSRDLTFESGDRRELGRHREERLLRQEERCRGSGCRDAGAACQNSVVVCMVLILSQWGSGRPVYTETDA